MTYGHEVRCEESWGHTLEAMLQPHTQVLNFALGAQGLNHLLEEIAGHGFAHEPEADESNGLRHGVNDSPTTSVRWLTLAVR